MAENMKFNYSISKKSEVCLPAYVQVQSRKVTWKVTSSFVFEQKSAECAFLFPLVDNICQVMATVHAYRKMQANRETFMYTDTRQTFTVLEGSRAFKIQNWSHRRIWFWSLVYLLTMHLWALKGKAGKTFTLYFVLLFCRFESYGVCCGKNYTCQVSTGWNQNQDKNNGSKLWQTFCIIILWFDSVLPAMHNAVRDKQSTVICLQF